jgi:hypothetical protein
MNKLFSYLYLFCLVASMLSGELKAAEDGTGITVSAAFALPDGSKALEAGQSALLAITLHNNSDKDLAVDAHKAKGFEQTNEDPMPARQAGVVPCYVATFVVEFLSSDGRVVHAARPLLTVSCILHPKEAVSMLVTVSLPKTPGSYRVKISGLQPAKEGSFGFPPKPAERPNLTDLAASRAFSAELDEVLIKPSNTTSDSPKPEK